jgi:uncharacterized lipoprotein YmbA
VAACGSSPPTRFYVLEAVAPAQRVQARSGEALRVAAVHLPQALARTEIVTGLAPNRVAVRGEDRWAAPLDDMTRRVLTQDLEQRLPDGAVIPPRAPAPRSARALVVTLESFGVESGGSARLQGSWALDDASGRPLLRRSVDLSQAASPGPQGQAAAMSQLLAGLADRIAADAGAASGTASGTVGP